MATPIDGEPDLRLALPEPGDEHPPTVDETWGGLEETAIFEATRDGELTLFVGAERPGPYRLVVERLDEPNARMRQWARAQRLHAEARREAQPLDALDEAASVWEALDETARAAKVLEALAAALHSRRRLAASVRAWDRAIEHRDRLEHEAMAADGRNRRGLLLRQLGRAEAARADFETALDLLTSTRPRHRAAVINNLGLLDQDDGRFRRARDRFQAAFDLLDGLPSLTAAGNRQIALVLENQARLETVQGRFGAARRLLEQATFHAGRAGSPRDALIEPRLQTAWLDLLEGRPEDARTILDGLAEQTAGRVDRVALTILDRLGTTLEALDEIGASWVAYRQAEAVARSLDYARGLGAVASNLCRLSVLYPGVTVDGPEAICREAVRTMRAVGDSNRLPTALYWRGRELETLGELDDATALYDEAARHLDRLTAHAVGLEGRTRFAEARSDPLQRLIDLSMRRHWNDPTAGHDRRAFLASERLRARGVLWRLLGSDVAADPTALATPAARGRYQRLVERLTALEASRRQPDAPAEAIGERIATTLDALDVAEQDLRESSPAYEELRPPERSLEAYQAALDDRTAVLATLTGESDSTLWVLTATTWTTYRLAPKHRLEGRARLLRKALARPPDPYATWSVGSRLATDLFGDDLERLTPLAGLRLAYIGDGALQQLPLSVLPIGRTEDGRRRYVVDEHEVIHLPSLNTLLAMRRLDRAPPTRSIALFADPIYRLDPRLDLVELDAAALRELFGDDRPAGRYGRLPFADREADWIAEAFPVTSRQIYRALDASRVHALDPGLADFGIIHFATHGELDSDRPELAALLLSEVADDGRRIPGRLLAQDLAGLDWRAELVVASACETGIDDTFRFEGVGGLARAMFQAGTPRTIASLWKVPSEPTAHLMDAFYDALDAGAAPGEALRAARLHLLRPVGDDRRGAWTAPHVWGGFILVGDWRAFELPD